ncbi:peptide/nickel transport system ATP-binding protein [Kribbella sp. VKM Ac-2571]|uniref:ABC transporter ATP-binding protein n=1 Tax=Kribbella sp. VKM Ac-2571 TaxID=2512222 RepID=UPI0010608102|nr:dipeptide ABC transporter ATP-binding protein [Kribbella sp. VKM Ac-2571]TDO66472.1 peptide/nickel transport system ATP-binding protein [Kribbella sp. VKM Ac-2571]
MSDPLLEVTGLKKHFPVKNGLLRRVVGQVKAVDGVDFTINRGETFGLVGESGCGKSTTGRTVLRLEEPTGGEVVYHHEELGPVNIGTADRQQLKRLRPEMQIIFQDPFSSLDARMTVGRIIAEPMVINRTHHGRELRDRVAELLTVVGLRPEHASRYPHAFSGGQRQRIGIARALALNPKLIVCDEPVSALDVSVQAQVLNLLESLQAQFDLTYLFVSHDLSVVEHIADRVAVMYLGKVVEVGTTDQLFYSPKMPYTEALLSALPKPDPRKRTRPTLLTGDVPSPADPPHGCHFHPRCKYAQDRCRTEVPQLRDLGDGQLAACHLADSLELKGAEPLPDVPVISAEEAVRAAASRNSRPSSDVAPHGTQEAMS